MKVVLFAGGYGTRISEETEIKPKPMIEIGGKPILWHIMKIYSHFGFNDFIICLGYKGYVIKEYFHHYYLHQSDVTIDLGKNCSEYYASTAEPWKITLVDTGLNTMTGGRLKRVQKYLSNESFMLTYGDGVADININKLVEAHKKNGSLVTGTSVQPAGRFGALDINEKGRVQKFEEKPKGDGAWINAGFFVCEPGIFDYITEGDATVWEKAPLCRLADEGQYAAYRHNGFWKPMDTLRDKNELDDLWSTGKAPWKLWE